MKRSVLFATLGIVLPLTLSAALILHASRAKSIAPPSPKEVHVDNFTFAPQTLTVSVNGTVTWVNKDDVPHVIASNDGLFKSKALDTDDRYSYTFTKPGTYAYYCSVHPKMVGIIKVQ